MRRPGYFLSLLFVLMLACAKISSIGRNIGTPLAGTQAVATPQAEAELPEIQESALVNSYDPARDPAQDLKQAIPIAQKQNKRIMLELGGDWCIWCRFMDEFYEAHPAILQFRADHFILVKVNVSPENKNEEFLSQFPGPAGYPHIYILDSDGTFLYSQDTAELEDGAKSYIPEVFMAFLEKWALPAR